MGRARVFALLLAVFALSSMAFLRSAKSEVFSNAKEGNEAISGDTLQLDDGRMLRLEGLKAPTDEARAKLQEMARGQPLNLDHISINRYGDTEAQVTAGSTWLQGEMLKAGLAFIYPPTGNEARLDDMRKAEQGAWQAKRGIWADEAYADIPADRAAGAYGRFAFVSGQVAKAERVKNKIYLNFGNDWRRDFTVLIAAHDLRAFRQENLDPLTLQGKTVRVRGWVERNYGPMIVATTPWQIEVVEPSGAQAARQK